MGGGAGRGGGEDEEKREIEGRSGIIVVLEVRLPVQVILLSHEVIQKWTVTVPCDQRPRKNKVPLDQRIRTDVNLYTYAHAVQ